MENSKNTHQEEIENLKARHTLTVQMARRMYDSAVEVSHSAHKVVSRANVAVATAIIVLYLSIFMSQRTVDKCDWLIASEMIRQEVDARMATHVFLFEDIKSYELTKKEVTRIILNYKYEKDKDNSLNSTARIDSTIVASYRRCR